MPLAAADPNAGGIVSRRALGVLALALAPRLAIWWLMPGNRYASDEAGYVQAALGLLNTGTQDLFWPPVTSWLIAGVAWLFGTTTLGWIRVAWIAMDIGCLVALRTLAIRVAPFVAAEERAQRRFVAVVTLGYAVYLPAISFAQFATSETPALLQTLLILVLVSGPSPSVGRAILAGTLGGTLVLTRPSLLPVIVLVPAALAVWWPHPSRWHHAVIVVCVAAAIVAADALNNLRVAGEITIARNSAYNLYIGNRDLYAEDLNLFSPRATPEQIEFRRQYFSGTLAYPTESAAELQQRAIASIIDAPGRFLRRAVGRLARVFAPKTDVLELVGGEQQAGIFGARSLALLCIANVQWAVVLFVGIPGLAWLWRAGRPWGALLLAVVGGSLPLCLVAISKPRYAFVFEPVLLLGAVAFAVAPPPARRQLRPSDRWIVAACTAFILWGWTAWLIFGVTSRLALSAPA